VSRTKLSLLMPIVGALWIAAGGCGGSEGSSDPVASQAIPRPTAPSAEDCAARELATDERARPLAPKPATYDYRLRGKEAVLGGQREIYDLPRSMPMIVTPSTRVGNLRCFRVQRRIRSSVVETSTFASRGDAVYLTKLQLQTETSSETLVPRPAVLAISPDDVEWSGSFAGPTRGRYRGELLGRRTIRVDGRPVRAIGIALDSSFAGEVTGTQRSEQWFSLDRHLVLRGRHDERRRFGQENLRTTYSTRLVSGAESDR
jgi:hypothetical protein